jgi:segregation and condensation protein B
MTRMQTPPRHRTSRVAKEAELVDPPQPELEGPMPEEPASPMAPPSLEASEAEEVAARRPGRRKVEIREATVPELEAIEALLAAADRPLADARIAELLSLSAEMPSAAFIEAAVRRINLSLELSGRVTRIRRLAGGWRTMVEPRFGALIEAMKGQRTSSRLSPAALETLSVVAYRQPITRAHIEAIRGVACGEVLRGLLERRLVRITGRAEEVGRPMLYGTTREFLLAFGLGSLADLPSAKE